MSGTRPDPTASRGSDSLATRAARLRRDPDDRVIAGVCAALGRELGIDPIILRVAAIGTALAGGSGIALYLIGWLLIPPLGEAQRAATSGSTRDDARPWRVVAGLGMLVLALLLAVRRMGFLFSDRLVWPVVLAAVGAGVIWYRSTSSRSGDAPVSDTRVERRRGFPVTPGRLALGGGLVIGAVLVFLVVTGVVGGVRQALLWTGAVVVAEALILVPVLWRFAASFGEERAERIRTQERAEVAAHLHDSVLQTLALVQRQADDPRAVATLARRQERELRAWLWGSGGGDGPQRFGAALEAAAAEIEEAHGVPIDVVAVGDRDLDPGAAAVVAAAREAMVNAAKFAGDGPVSVYSEAAGGDLEVFVRDRGAGFDPERIPEGRHGVRDSIVGRMVRHGGSATVHSGPDGTEVEIRLPGGDR
ncbi:MAG: PspC domain-containing protein [Thermoleophilia bacterium]|nr:PspC domain-containing protein [Thermoleophilia bacterium]